MVGRVQRVIRLLSDQAAPAMPSAFFEERQKIWRQLTVQESESAVERWQCAPQQHAEQLRDALERLAASHGSAFDRLLLTAGADSVTPQAAHPPPEERGSVEINIGKNQGGVVAGRDIQMTAASFQGAAAPQATVAPAPQAAATAAPPGSDDKSGPERRLKVLFLGANPDDSTRLRLDREVRAIDHALRMSEHGNRVRLEQHWAVQVGDLQDCLFHHQPMVVHFSGHGTAESLLLEDATGRAHQVSGQLLERLFGMFRKSLSCVVLNCCHSVDQAAAIARVVDVVVGNSTSVEDQAAIHFAVGFYRALTMGRSVHAAFDHGCLEVDLFQPDQGEIPKLICPRTDPARLFLLPKHRAGGSR